jgi:hypothetical protein
MEILAQVLAAKRKSTTIRGLGLKIPAPKTSRKLGPPKALLCPREQPLVEIRPEDHRNEPQIENAAHRS